MKNISIYLLFAVLLFTVVLDFAINAGDGNHVDSANGWEIHFQENPATVPDVGLSHGFIMHPSGHVLTNNYVAEHTEQIMIMASDDMNYGLAVVACDHACEMELMRIKTPNGQKFRAIPMVNLDVAEAASMDYSVPSRWTRELLNEIRSDKWKFQKPER
jgi:hypothetical protein